MELDRYVDLTSPHGLFVRAYLVSDKEEATAGQKALEGIKERYSSQAVMTDSSTISIESGGDRYSLQLIEEPDCRIFVLISKLPHGDSATNDWVHHVADYLRQSEAILQLLPERPISQFTVLVGFADSEEAAISLAERCSRYLECEEKARGITRGYLVATLDTIAAQDGDYLLEGYPTNASAEISQCEAIIKRFRNFLDRADALRTQLETTLNSIQTYLGFAQQKAMERQGNIVKVLTWVLATSTIILVLIEVLAALHILR